MVAPRFQEPLATSPPLSADQTRSNIIEKASFHVGSNGIKTLASPRSVPYDQAQVNQSDVGPLDGPGLTPTENHQPKEVKKTPQSFWFDTLKGPDTRNALQSASVSAVVDTGAIKERKTIVVDLDEPSLLDQLAAIEVECKCSRKTLVEAVWAIVLRHHSSSEEVMFGVVPDTQDLTHTLDLNLAYPVRALVHTDRNFIELVRDLDDFHLDASPYASVGYTNISPLMHTPLESAIYLSRSHMTLTHHSESLFPIVLGVTGSLGLRVTIDYCSSIDSREAEILLSHFIEGLRECLFKIYLPHTVIRTIGIASDVEILRMVKKNRSEKHELGTTIVHLLEDAAIRFADRTAVEDDRHESITFSELSAYSNGLARSLRLQQRDIVPICMQRSIDLVLSIVAVLKSGAAYTILDPSAPAERNLQIAAECNAKVVLVRGDAEVPFTNAINVQELIRKTKKLELSNLDINISPDDHCYIIFTSGSSGKPKGVVCTHGAATNGMRYHSLNGKSRWLLFYNPSFSAAQRTILSTLIRGGTLVVARPEKLQSELPKIINEHDVTSLGITPSALSTLQPEDVPGLQQVTLVGERIPQDLVDEWAPHLELRNTYGLSEVTQLNFGTQLQPESNPRVVGKPVDTTSAYVFVPGTTDLAPVDVPGELCLAGAQLGVGYLNDSKRSEQAFIDNPLGPGKLYRTGDEARMLHDGTFEILGRIDFQTKINGQKVEPQEVDNALSRHDSVAGSVTIGAQIGDRSLLATGLILEDGVDWSDQSMDNLISHAQDLLPRYMVPSYMFPISEIPRNQNGKIDLGKFKTWVEGKSINDLVQLSNPESDQPALTDSKEVDIARIWAKELGIEQSLIGRKHSFLGLGGSSIQAIRTLAKLRRVGLVISLVDVLSDMSVGEMASKHERQSLAELTHDLTPFELIDDEALRQSLQQESGVADAYPATPLQQDLLASLAAEDDSYTYRRTWNVSKLHLDKLRQSLEQVFNNNGIYRTTFRLHGRGMFQLVRTDLAFPWHESSLNIDEFLQRDRQQLFTIDGLLLRITLVQKSILVITMHHSLFDFWSHRFLYQNTAAHYLGNEVKQRPNYNHFAAFLKQSDPKPDEAFWKQYLAGAEPTKLNIAPAGSVAKLQHALPYNLQSHLKDKHLTTGAVLYTAWAMVLAKNTNSKDVMFLTSLSGRDAPVFGVEDIDGPTLAMAPQRITFDDKVTLGEVAQSTGAGSVQLAVHAKYGLSNALAAGGIDHTYFDSFLNVLVSPEQDLSTASLFQRYGPKPHWDQQWTTIDVEEKPHTTELRIAGRMEPRRLQCLLESFVVAIDTLITSPTATLTETSIMGDSEYGLLYYELSNRETLHVPGEALLHERFEAHAKQKPQTIAIDWNAEVQFTYAELDSTSNQLAHYLISSGVKQGDLIPLLLERSMDTMVAILGVMKAGAAYVPMDPANPATRNAFIIQDVGASTMIVHREHFPVFPDAGTVSMIVLDELDLSEMPTSHPSVVTSTDDLAYVIYTSGSTGRPKGVKVPHYAAASAVTSMAVAEGRYNGPWRTLQFANYVFDASVQDFFNTLSTGGTLCMAPKDVLLSDLPGAINRMKAKQAILTPTIARLLEPSSVPSLEVLIVGGEPLSRDVIEAWSSGHQILNVYGPTETSMVVTTKDVQPGGNVSNIGKPFPTVMALIVEPESDQLVPYGAVGELCIAGPQVTAGYINRPDLTAAAFVDGQAVGVKSMYRTGDLAHWLPGGDIACLGRKDGQVKIHGHRIELGEIEVAILKTELVKEAAVIIAPANGKPVIAAFCLFDAAQDVVLQEPDKFTERAAELRERLIKTGLTPYMMPNFVLPVGNMPKLPSKKVDRKMLKQILVDMDSALLRTYAATTPGEKHQVLPAESPEEIALEQFWSEVLQIAASDIGKKADFMSLGGDSITAISLSSVAAKAGYTLSVGNILKQSVLEDMAKTMSKKAARTGPKRKFLVPEDVIQKTKESGLDYDNDIDYVYPCPPGQAEFLSQGSRPEQMWNMMATRRLMIDKERWIEATTKLIQANDIFRTSWIRSADGEWYGVVLKSCTPELTTVHCADAAELDAAIDVCWSAPFTFGKPFIKFAMLVLASGEIDVCIKMDHAVYDGTSLRIFDDHFEAILNGKEIPQHGEFKELAFHLFESDKATTLDYWKKIMSGKDNAYLGHADAPNITTIKRAPLDTRLYELSKSCGVTPSTIFQAAYQIWLANASSSTDISFDYLLSGRNVDLPDPLNINGTLANFLPLRLQIKESATLHDYLQQTQDAFWSLTANGNVGLDEIYRAADLDRKLVGNRTMFLFQPFEPATMPDESRWIIMAKSRVRMFQPFGLVVEVSKAPGDSYKLAVMYDDKLYTAEEVESIVDDIKSTLTWFVEKGQNGESLVKELLA